MRRILMSLFTMLLCLQSAQAMSVDQFIDTKLAPVLDKLAALIFFPIPVGGNDVPLIIFWILFAVQSKLF